MKRLIEILFVGFIVYVLLTIGKWLISFFISNIIVYSGFPPLIGMMLYYLMYWYLIGLIIFDLNGWKKRKK